MLNRMLIRELIDSADPTEMAAHSFRNYHVRGADYLCLHRTPRLTVKAYFFAEVWHNRMGYAVWPHTHRYAFEHWTLKGTIRNHRFAIGGTAPFWLHTFDAATRRASALMPVPLLNVSDDKKVGHFALEPHEIHTISIVGEAIAVQLQYHDTERQSVLFAPDQDVTCGGGDLLYMPMSETTYRHGLGVLMSALGEMP